MATPLQYGETHCLESELQKWQRELRCSQESMSRVRSPRYASRCGRHYPSVCTGSQAWAPSGGALTPRLVLSCSATAVEVDSTYVNALRGLRACIRDRLMVLLGQKHPQVALLLKMFDQHTQRLRQRFGHVSMLTQALSAWRGAAWGRRSRREVAVVVQQQQMQGELEQRAWEIDRLRWELERSVAQVGAVAADRDAELKFVMERVDAAESRVHFLESALSWQTATATQHWEEQLVHMALRAWRAATLAFADARSICARKAHEHSRLSSLRVSAATRFVCRSGKSFASRGLQLCVKLWRQICLRRRERDATKSASLQLCFQGWQLATTRSQCTACGEHREQAARRHALQLDRYSAKMLAAMTLGGRRCRRAVLAAWGVATQEERAVRQALRSAFTVRDGAVSVALARSSAADQKCILHRCLAMWRLGFWQRRHDEMRLSWRRRTAHAWDRAAATAESVRTSALLTRCFNIWRLAVVESVAAAAVGTGRRHAALRQAGCDAAECCMGRAGTRGLLRLSLIAWRLASQACADRRRVLGGGAAKAAKVAAWAAARLCLRHWQLGVWSAMQAAAQALHASRRLETASWQAACRLQTSARLRILVCFAEWRRRSLQSGLLAQHGAFVGKTLRLMGLVQHRAFLLSALFAWRQGVVQLLKAVWDAERHRLGAEQDKASRSAQSCFARLTARRALHAVFAAWATSAKSQRERHLAMDMMRAQQSRLAAVVLKRLSRERVSSSVGKTLVAWRCWVLQLHSEISLAQRRHDIARSRQTWEWYGMRAWSLLGRCRQSKFFIAWSSHTRFEATQREVRQRRSELVVHVLFKTSATNSQTRLHVVYLAWSRSAQHARVAAAEVVHRRVLAKEHAFLAQTKRCWGRYAARTLKHIFFRALAGAVSALVGQRAASERQRAKQSWLAASCVAKACDASTAGLGQIVMATWRNAVHAEKCKAHQLAIAAHAAAKIIAVHLAGQLCAALCVWRQAALEARKMRLGEEHASLRAVREALCERSEAWWGRGDARGVQRTAVRAWRGLAQNALEQRACMRQAARGKHASAADAVAARAFERSIQRLLQCTLLNWCLATRAGIRAHCRALCAKTKSQCRLLLASWARTWDDELRWLSFASWQGATRNQKEGRNFSASFMEQRARLTSRALDMLIGMSSRSVLQGVVASWANEAAISHRKRASASRSNAEAAHKRQQDYIVWSWTTSVIKARLGFSVRGWHAVVQLERAKRLHDAHAACWRSAVSVVTTKLAMSSERLWAAALLREWRTSAGKAQIAHKTEVSLAKLQERMAAGEQRVARAMVFASSSRSHIWAARALSKWHAAVRRKQLGTRLSALWDALDVLSLLRAVFSAWASATRRDRQHVDASRRREARLAGALYLLGVFCVAEDLRICMTVWRAAAARGLREARNRDDRSLCERRFMAADRVGKSLARLRSGCLAAAVLRAWTSLVLDARHARSAMLHRLAAAELAVDAAWETDGRLRLMRWFCSWRLACWSGRSKNRQLAVRMRVSSEIKCMRDVTMIKLCFTGWMLVAAASRERTNIRRSTLDRESRLVSSSLLRISFLMWLTVVHEQRVASCPGLHAHADQRFSIAERAFTDACAVRAAASVYLCLVVWRLLLECRRLRARGDRRCAAVAVACGLSWLKALLSRAFVHWFEELHRARVRRLRQRHARNERRLASERWLSTQEMFANTEALSFVLLSWKAFMRARDQRAAADERCFKLASSAGLLWTIFMAWQGARWAWRAEALAAECHHVLQVRENVCSHATAVWSRQSRLGACHRCVSAWRGWLHRNQKQATAQRMQLDAALVLEERAQVFWSFSLDYALRRTAFLLWRQLFLCHVAWTSAQQELSGRTSTTIIYCVEAVCEARERLLLQDCMRAWCHQHGRTLKALLHQQRQLDGEFAKERERCLHSLEHFLCAASVRTCFVIWHLIVQNAQQPLNERRPRCQRARRSAALSGVVARLRDAYRSLRLSISFIFWRSHVDRRLGTLAQEQREAACASLQRISLAWASSDARVFKRAALAAWAAGAWACAASHGREALEMVEIAKAESLLFREALQRRWVQTARRPLLASAFSRFRFAVRVGTAFLQHKSCTAEVFVRCLGILRRSFSSWRAIAGLGRRAWAAAVGEQQGQAALAEAATRWAQARIGWCSKHRFVTAWRLASADARKGWQRELLVQHWTERLGRELELCIFLLWRLAAEARHMQDNLLHAAPRARSAAVGNAADPITPPSKQSMSLQARDAAASAQSLRRAVSLQQLHQHMERVRSTTSLLRSSGGGGDDHLHMNHTLLCSPRSPRPQAPNVSGLVEATSQMRRRVESLQQLHQHAETLVWRCTADLGELAAETQHLERRPQQHQAKQERKPGSAPSLIAVAELAAAASVSCSNLPDESTVAGATLLEVRRVHRVHERLSRELEPTLSKVRGIVEELLSSNRQTMALVSALSGPVPAPGSPTHSVRSICSTAMSEVRWRSTPVQRPRDALPTVLFQSIADSSMGHGASVLASVTPSAPSATPSVAVSVAASAPPSVGAPSVAPSMMSAARSGCSFSLTAGSVFTAGSSKAFGLASSASSYEVTAARFEHRYSFAERLRNLQAVLPRLASRRGAASGADDGPEGTPGGRGGLSPVQPVGPGDSSLALASPLMPRVLEPPEGGALESAMLDEDTFDRWGEMQEGSIRL